MSVSPERALSYSHGLRKPNGLLPFDMRMEFKFAMIAANVGVDALFSFNNSLVSV